MRHDLQNSVAIIMGMADVMRDETSSEGIRDDLEIIAKNAVKLKKMINDAAKFGQLESEAGLKFRQLDLNAVISEVITGLGPLLEEKGMRVEFEADNRKIVEACIVVEDVFLNLLSNAIKYSPENGVIRVGITEKGKKWLISVADQGSGVPDKHKKIIFERFKRGEKTGIKGVGLGLAIVKRVVEIHKGTVWVEDNPGGGSIFYVELPMER
jgi:signal transduction histidine kinase